MVDDEPVDEAPAGQDEPTDVQAPEGSSDEAAAQPEEVDYTSETFDPAALDEALRPAYNQMSKQFKGTYTQKFQELAEQRKETDGIRQAYADLNSDDPEAQRAAADFFGLDLVDETPEAPDDDDEYDEDPVETLRQELAALKGTLAERDQKAQQVEQHDAMEHYINSSFAQLQDDTGVELDADEIHAIENQAIAINPQQPDVRGAYEFLYQTVLPKGQKRYAAKKVAHQPGQGQSGSPAVDMSNTRERRAELARIIESGMAGESG